MGPEDPPTIPPAWTGADAGVVEWGFLLPAELAAVLEEAARGRGLTIGQVVRRLIRDFIDQPSGEGHGSRGETA